MDDTPADLSKALSRLADFCDELGELRGLLTLVLQTAQRVRQLEVEVDTLNRLLSFLTKEP